jgi:hypothetical protein
VKNTIAEFFVHNTAALRRYIYEFILGDELVCVELEESKDNFSA